MQTFIYYLLVSVSTCLFCFGLVLFIKKPFFKLAIHSASQLDIIYDKLLEEELKDKKVLQNLIKVLKYLLLCLIIVSLLIAGVVLLPILFVSLNDNIKLDTSSSYFYLSMLVGSFTLFLIKKKGEYSYWSKLLHTIILNNYALGRYLLERELKRNVVGETSTDQDFLIVSGLARSGTTAMTNLIFDEDNFHSIKYSNVPFLLSPNLWQRLYNPKKTKAKERAHQDSVLVSENSIEALEEYFFKVLTNDSYIKDGALVKHSISNEQLKKYVNYQNLFKRKDATIYIAKNNNFLLRYESIRNLNKQFKVLLMFRNPIDHAKSLMRQHQNFVKQQNYDAFILDYMNWLGHFEFGLNQKHFEFNQNSYQNSKCNDKNSLCFWIEVWLNYYSYVVEIFDPLQNLFLIHYEDLANNPGGLKRKIGMLINKDLKLKFIDPYEQNNISSQIDHNIKDEQLRKVKDLYGLLLSLRIKVNEYNNI